MDTPKPTPPKPQPPKAKPKAPAKNSMPPKALPNPVLSREDALEIALLMAGVTHKKN